MPESFWSEHRVYYRSICDLCTTVDSAMGPLTLVSFSNNLWFICVQLLLSLKYHTSNCSQFRSISFSLNCQHTTVNGACILFLVLAGVSHRQNVGCVDVLGWYKWRIERTAESVSRRSTRVVVFGGKLSVEN